MKYLSRKLIAFTATNLILVMIFLVSIVRESSLLTSEVLITLMLFVVLNGVTYIGGKALETWAKSKWFHNELVGR